MLLAGGQGSRLGVLTARMAKPAVSFGGKYRIIDFPLSNCINSGIDTVGVLTQYQPLRLNAHIGIGIPWDLDRNVGGVSVLPPYEKMTNTEWYTGTANAIFQNMEYMASYHPDYVLILSGDHIYRMDYEEMLSIHKKNKADVTIAVMPVPEEEARRFGIMITDENGRIVDFEEKPERPRSNLASMGIYIFSWETLSRALTENANQSGLDFGRHIIPWCRDRGYNLHAYLFDGYWKDVGTLTSYWEANMELIDIVPEFNLYEEHSRIYTKSLPLPPQYFGYQAQTERSIIGEGSEIFGTVEHSIIGCGVRVCEGAVVRDSILMNDCVVGEGSSLSKVIAAEEVHIGNRVRIGEGELRDNETDPHIYRDGLCTIGEGSVIPDDVTIGKNVMIFGETTAADYPDGVLASGRTLSRMQELW